jgi:hypothetical protein
MATRGHHEIGKNLWLFSVGYTLPKDGPQAILAPNKSTFSLAVRVRQTPFKPYSRGGHIPLWNPLVYHFDWVWRRKRWSLLQQHFLRPKLDIFCAIWGLKSVVVKSRQNTSIWSKGLTLRYRFYDSLFVCSEIFKICSDLIVNSAYLNQNQTARFPPSDLGLHWSRG